MTNRHMTDVSIINGETVPYSGQFCNKVKENSVI